MSNEVKKDLLERSVIYHVSTLTDFQKKVNSAAASIAIRELVLVWKGNWGTLLEKAWQQVSVEGFAFKKGKSHSKVYGESGNEECPPKKVNKTFRRDKYPED